MGPVSHPAIVLALLLACFMPKMSAWDAPDLSGRSDASTASAAVARPPSSLALERAYSLGGARVHARFEIEAYRAALATLGVDAKTLGIRIGIQHDASGFATSLDVDLPRISDSVLRDFFRS